MLLTFRNYVCVRLCLLGLALVYTAVDAELYEGDPCQMKDSLPGICRLQSNCTEIMEAIKRGTMSVDDPVRCSYQGDEEVICCPSKRKSKNVESTTTSTTVRTPTTQPNSFETKAITTTTEKPDFWLHLLNTTTATPQPDFWLDLLSTTTPKPLKIGGKELDSDSEFFDLNQLLQNGGSHPESHSERLANQPRVDNNNINARNPNSNHGQNNGRNTQPIVNPSSPNLNHNIDSFQNQNHNRPNGNVNWNGNPNNNQRQIDGRNTQPIVNPSSPNLNHNIGSFQNQNRNRPNGNVNWNGNPNNNQRQNNARDMQPIVNPSSPNLNQNIGPFQNENHNRPNGNVNWNGNPNNNQRQKNARDMQPAMNLPGPNIISNTVIFPNQNQNLRNGNTNWNGASRWNNPRNLNGDINRNNGDMPNWANVPPSKVDFSNNIVNQNIHNNQFNRPNTNPSNASWQNQNLHPNVMNPNIGQQHQHTNILNNNVGNNPDWQPNEPQIEDLETAASSNRLHQINRDMGVGLPKGNIMPNPRPVHTRPPNTDPIETVFNNLVHSGMNIVKAKVENVEREHREFIFPQDINTLITTTTIRTPLTDPFAPFQFRPQHEDIFDTQTNGFWNMDMQSLNQSTIVPAILNATIVPPRSGERPAITACREIEAALSPGLTPHILDGTPVKVGEYPHMAAIGYTPIGDDKSKEYVFRCGGTLISNKFVLTAAHCVNSRDATPSIVRLGAADFKNVEEMKNAVDIPIKNTTIHPNYSNSKKYDDIALLELDREITVTEFITPTCLYTDTADPSPASQLYVTGWGTVNTQTRQFSDILLKARLQIVPLNRCNESYLENGANRQLNRGVIETQLCAGDPEFTKDACQGDSGGPLNLVVDEAAKTYRIVGVISTGFGCASAVPGLYTRVSAYLDFIEGVVWPQM